jgi:TonB family protein
LIAATVLVASAGAVLAQASAPPAELQFNIPSQPLESALEAFGTASRLQVLYETALTKGLRSTEVKGMYTLEVALRRLLLGTGLDFDYTEERAFTLVPAQLRSLAAQARSIASFHQYLGTVQASVMAALCGRAETRPGAFSLAMQFWIGGSGRIEKSSLLKSTGAGSRDAAIADTLAQVAFSAPPPASMPQPVTMVLRAGPPSGDDACAVVKR